MELRINLKVCEGCGCLWYRTQVETRVYCTPCENRFKEFPTPQSRKRPGRPRKTTLSTVFAVQASAQSDWELEIARSQKPGVASPDIADYPAFEQSSAPLELLPALMNPLAASVSTCGALSGGAQ
jgi:hypothetical protein